MTVADWDPLQYERFKQQRAQPFWDLVGLLRLDGPLSRCVDLGCGSGELTAAAATRLRCDEMVGIDSSPSMLAAAQPHASSTVRFQHGDIAGWTAPGDHDLVLSNAA